MGLLVLLGACADASDGSTQYLTRLARVLDRPVPQPAVLPVVSYPDRRALRLPYSEASLDWLEFARLHRCDMGDLLGYRNSGLGRVMGALERYRYEQAWAQVAERCARDPALAAGPATQALLARLRQEKARDARLAWWNLVFAGPELQRWWRPRGAADWSSAEVARPTAATALLALRQYEPPPVGQDEAVPGAVIASSLAPLGQQLAVLAEATGGGAALERWARAAMLLRQATTLLAGASARLCRNGQPTPSAQRLKNVFRKFYVAQLQGELALATNADRPWVEQFNAMVARNEALLPPVFARWHEATLSLSNEGSLWLATRQAFRNHSEAWQGFAKGCGLDLFAPSAMVRPPVLLDWRYG